MLWMKCRIAVPDKSIGSGGMVFFFFPFYFLIIFTTADIPDKIFKDEISLFLSVLSIEILTGILCVTFVKFPEALFAGIREKTDAVLDPIRNTLPLKFHIRESINSEFYILSDLNFRNICFFKICNNPEVIAECNCKNRLTRLNNITWKQPSFCNNSISRCI